VGGKKGEKFIFVKGTPPVFLAEGWEGETGRLGDMQTKRGNMQSEENNWANDFAFWKGQLAEGKIRTSQGDKPPKPAVRQSSCKWEDLKKGQGEGDKKKKSI